MIQDIEEESKTKFSMDVEFSFSFKALFSNLVLSLISWRRHAILTFVAGPHQTKVFQGLPPIPGVK